MPSSGPFLALAALLLAAIAFAGEITLPDPLLAGDGTRIADVRSWTTRRRGELLETFRREVYGRNPVERPGSLSFTVTQRQPGAMGGAADLRQVRIAWTGPHGAGGMDLVLFVPTARRAAAPCMLLLCNRGRRNIDPTRATRSGFWPAEEIVARGYAAAAFHVGDVDPDSNEGFADGVHAVFDEPASPRPGDAWATIAAWAWGASRAVDYLVQDRDIDARRIAVVGHSRGGKTSLWCGAQDERVALTVSNCSGSSGAAAARGKSGQDIAAITREFPHWFCGNYAAWGGKEWRMPFDQHEVLALCAPRLVYVGSASKDWGADPRAEFRSCVAAAPVWGLWRKTGLGATAMPAAGAPLHEGSIGYHLRDGEHDLTPWDWQRFMDFADRHMTGAARPGPR